jgi:hypothetical protein
MTSEEIKEKAKTDFDLKIQSSFFLPSAENVYLRELLELYKKENENLKIVNKGKSKKQTFYKHLENVNKLIQK